MATTHPLVTPRHRIRRKQKPIPVTRPILATLCQLALAAELYACGKRLNCHPIITAIATLIGRKGYQPLTASILAYCRTIDAASYDRSSVQSSGNSNRLAATHSGLCQV